MSRAIRIAHISDLHLSKYGVPMSHTAKLGLMRLPTQSGKGRRLWETTMAQEGWQIQRLRFFKSEYYRLLDGEHVHHGFSKDPDKLKSFIERWKCSEIKSLIDDPPDEQEVLRRLEKDPDNTNLRFLILSRKLLELDPDTVVITGDITDNGTGYELVSHFLAPFIRERRLITVPGNHDLNILNYPLSGERLSLEMKTKKYLDFTTSIGLKTHSSGFVSVSLGENVTLFGFNSCAIRRKLIPTNALGEVGEDQLDLFTFIAEREPVGEDHLRLACLHHHITDLFVAKVKLAQLGAGISMKLKDAENFIKCLKDHNVSIVMNGHRHIGYELTLNTGLRIFSSPSVTLGDRATGQRYFHLIHIRDHKVESERIKL